jgi:hypothetical protein
MQAKVYRDAEGNAAVELHPDEKEEGWFSQIVDLADFRALFFPGGERTKAQWIHFGARMVLIANASRIVNIAITQWDAAQRQLKRTVESFRLSSSISFPEGKALLSEEARFLQIRFQLSPGASPALGLDDVFLLINDQ